MSDFLEGIDYQTSILSGLARPVTESILVIPVWKPSFCRDIINAAEAHGIYKPLENDLKYGNAPGQEIRIDQFSPLLKHYFKWHVLTYMKNAIEHFYRYNIFKDERTDFRTPFIVKYTMDGQRSMQQHHDASLLSFSIKLNDDYKGSDLVFPRQQWTNINVPVGHAVVFPGQLTHPHYVNELREGSRFGMTAWIRGMDLRSIGD